MPRIRTIKPEFWDSPGTAMASLRARLFFIAMWGWTDDWGIGTANAKQLIGYAFPNDDDISAADFPRLAAEVAECFGVVFYEVDGRPYFAIPSWDKHQKNERRAAKRNPTPDQGLIRSAEMHGNTAQTSGNNPLGTGEQGNRGTGEQTLSSIEDEHADEPKIPYSELFLKWWAHYPRKESKGDAWKAWEVLRKSKQLPNEADLAAATLRYAASSRGSEPQFIKLPAGWLRDRKWEDEASAPVAGPAKKRFVAHVD